MSKQQALIILGAWVIVFLFLGFPSALDKIFAILTGAAVIMLAYSLRAKSAPAKNVPFVEHKAEAKPSDNIISNNIQ